MPWAGGGLALKFYHKDNWIAHILLIPALVIICFVLLYPILSTLLQSFGLGGRAPAFTLKHYARLLTDRSFHNSLINTLKFVFISVGLDLVLGLGAAMLLIQPIRGQKLFRISALLPWAIPAVVTGATWKWMYNTTSGIINAVLTRLGVISEPVLWLSNKSTALASIIVANVWRGFPYVMLILLAGLQTIPEEIYEAGAIDGTNKWQRFRYLTLPSLRKNIIVVLALVTVWEFRQIDLVMTMTGGGPGSLTDVLSTTIFKNYFRFFNFEYASAMAVVMSCTMLIISIPYVRGILSD